jgi:signal transduction histidine kinase
MTQPVRMPDPERPDVAGDPGALLARPAEWFGARLEHSLRSLLQLGHELTVSLDLYETADLLLFNLMGQLGTGRSALWLLDGDEPVRAVVIRSHGFARRPIEAVGEACAPGLLVRFTASRDPVLAWRLPDNFGPVAFELVRQAGIALFAPVCVRQEIRGWLALGSKVGGQPYSAADLEVLKATLGIVGASLENVRLYNRVLEANRQLSLTNERLHELDQLKSEFLCNVNHELRTPLTVVIGALECLVGGSQAEGLAQRVLHDAQENAMRLKSLVENLLTFSDAANARLPIQLVSADVRETLRPYCARRLPGITEGLRELSYVPAEDLPPARFDPQRLLQILDELVDNAIKFTPRGSHLRLSVTRASVDGAEWVRIEFADDGPGIPPARTDSIFRSFEQVDGSATRKVGGLGMGLAFAQQLAERMGSRLSAASTLGSGTTFTLLLPTA